MKVKCAEPPRGCGQEKDDWEFYKHYKKDGTVGYRQPCRRCYSVREAARIKERAAKQQTEDNQ